MRRALPAVLVGLVVLAVGIPVFALSDTGSPMRRGVRSGSPVGAPDAAGRSRIDRIFIKARRRYLTEASGSTTRYKLNAIVHAPALVRAVRSGNIAAIRAAALHQQAGTHQHISHLRLWLGRRLVADLGVPFCVRGPTAPIRSKRGKVLATVQITVQDVIGFIRIMRRTSPAQVIARGAYGDVRTSLHAAAATRLPDRGFAVVAGRRYAVRSFRETALSGEPLHIWILVQA